MSRPPGQMSLGLPNHWILGETSWIRRYLVEARDTGKTYKQRAWMVKDRLWVIKEWLRAESARNPNREHQEWFKSFVALWKKLEEAYHIAKQISEGAYKNDFKKRKKLEELLSWQTGYFLDALDEFVTEEFYKNTPEHVELSDQTVNIQGEAKE